MASHTIWTDIARVARLAPTPHNTQPFRLRPRGDDVAEVLLVSERLLPEEDHGNLYVMSAFGIFASTLERAARQFGRALSVDPVVALEPAKLTHASGVVLLGHARLGAACDRAPEEELLASRRTSRLPYRDEPVEVGALAEMVRVTAAGGHRLLTHDAADVVKSLLHLNARAIIDNLQLGSEREEIRGWHRLGATPEHGDGLWQKPMNQPAWELWTAFAMPRAFAIPGLRDFAVHRYLKTQAGTRHVALLCGAFATWPELVAAGRTLMELWLVMATHRIYMQPFGSMLTNPVYAEELVRRFQVRDCWLIFRFGYSDVPPAAPRLESILLP